MKTSNDIRFIDKNGIEKSVEEALDGKLDKNGGSLNNGITQTGTNQINRVLGIGNTQGIGSERGTLNFHNINSTTNYLEIQGRNPDGYDKVRLTNIRYFDISGRELYSPSNPPTLEWENITATLQSGVSGGVAARINKQSRLLAIWLGGITGISSIGQTFLKLTLPSGYTPHTLQRGVICMDLTGGGRDAVGIDVQPNGDVQAYPFQRPGEVWTGTMNGNIFVYLWN